MGKQYLEREVESPSIRKSFNRGAKSLIGLASPGLCHFLTRDTNFKEMGMVGGALALPLLDAYLTTSPSTIPTASDLVVMATYTIFNVPMNAIEAFAGSWIGKEIGRSIDNKIDRLAEIKDSYIYGAN